MSPADDRLPDIPLDELARLIRILGLLGSSHDGEVLNAARLAQRWVVEKHTDWETLLTPPAEPGVLSVGVVESGDALTERVSTAYDHGYQAGVAAGLAKAMAQVKAQATAAQQPGWPSHWTQAAAQAATGHSPFTQPVGQGPAPQGPVRAPAAPAGGYPLGSWQAVCLELLERDDAGVPGVLRSRERTFVADVLGRGFATLTAAQEHWLRDIAGRNSLSW